MPHKDSQKRKEYHKTYSENLSEKQKLGKKVTDKIWWNSPKGKYSLHKYSAARRKISWEFTFDTWWKMWEESGQYLNRGGGKGKYCMCRYNDEGPYSPNNVYIATTETNKKDAWLNNKLRLPTGQTYSEVNY